MDYQEQSWSGHGHPVPNSRQYLNEGRGRGRGRGRDLGVLQTPLSLLPPPSPPTHQTCSYCFDRYEGNEMITMFRYRCHKCHTRICANCLKDLFLLAIKEETSMPPKCCSIIPSTVMTCLLNNQQLEAYKEKFEEWMTPQRLYCPEPRCSKFISPRLISRSIVSCPACKLAICVACKQKVHTGRCNGNDDLDPYLKAALKSWGVKRCPKCRHGVRKMHGCLHMQCRCGHHFCWRCLRPKSICEGDCNEEERGSESIEPQAGSSERTNNDDLDAGLLENSRNMNLGDEPRIEEAFLSPWNCSHKFRHPQVRTLSPPVPLTHLSKSTQISYVYRFTPLECNRCWTHVYPERESLLRKSNLELNAALYNLGYLSRDELYRTVDKQNWLGKVSDREWSLYIPQRYDQRDMGRSKGRELVALECQGCGIIICGDCLKHGEKIALGGGDNVVEKFLDLGDEH